mmetsp:Transcript_10082/g.61288  ORF Transcript_10082/g.61288 Transcript_10082/m.61288 type:complete len:173 (+) Transcript_10082:820-1338(+)
MLVDMLKDHYSAVPASIHLSCLPPIKIKFTDLWSDMAPAVVLSCLWLVAHTAFRLGYGQSSVRISNDALPCTIAMHDTSASKTSNSSYSVHMERLLDVSKVQLKLHRKCHAERAWSCWPHFHASNGPLDVLQAPVEHRAMTRPRVLRKGGLASSKSTRRGVLAPSFRQGGFG